MVSSKHRNKNCCSGACLGLSGALAVLLALCALCASASADPFGELGSPFGSPSQVNPEGPHAFGVDTSNDNTYLADGQLNEEAEYTKYRLQRFNPAGQVVASASFNVPAHEVGKVGYSEGLEGVAVDPTHHLVYLLVLYERLGVSKIDAEETAAGALYAFKVSGENELVSVASEGGQPAPITTKTVFEAQSEKRGQALLRPSGIAVDPTTGDVDVLGAEDIGSKEEEFVAAVQQVHSNGTLGARFLDTDNCLAGEPVPAEPACEETGGGVEPNSPIVSSGGKVLVEAAENQIWQIPTSEEKQFKNPGEFAIVPKRAFALGEQQQILAFTEEFGELQEKGDGMSFVPTGASTGTIYVDAQIEQNHESPEGRLTQGGFRFPGALALDYSEEGNSPKISVSGWTGGPPVGEKCSIEAPGGVEALVAGATNGVFVFAVAAAPGDQPIARVSKFGPGGEGCQHARATSAGSGGISALANGKELPAFPPTAEVELSSEVFEGNALSATWELENLESKAKEVLHTSSVEEFQTTKVPPRKFPEGEYKVTEKIHTDNLASPELTLVRELHIGSHVVASFTCSPGIVHHPTTCNASKSLDPNGDPLTYEWDFGDGTAKVTTTNAVESHTYTSAGSHTVTLTVTDHKLPSASTKLTIVIPEESNGGSPPSSGGGGGGTGSSGGGSTPSNTNTQVSSGPSGQSQVQGTHEVHLPNATLAGTSVSVAPTGTFALKVTCPTGESACMGTITLKTLGAVQATVAAHGKKKKPHKVVLTLASGSFTVAGGQLKSLTLHLSAKARALLAKTHVLRARATLVAHDTSGASHTTQTIVTLRPHKTAHHGKR